MQFTYRNPDRATDPSQTVAGARSLVVGALAYGADPFRRYPGRPVGRVARYARTDHYARLRTALEAVAAPLRELGHRAVVVADQNGLVDREAAVRAGLGWYGKSTNVLLPGAGSWFVLGSVVTDAELPPDEPRTEDCGGCRRCLDGCPTGAIVAPGVVDARRCLAWTVQGPGPIPVDLRLAMGDRIYGCDDCQEVCPPNRHAAVIPADDQAPLADDRGTGDGDAVDLLDLLARDDEDLLSTYGRWYIAERDPRHLRRNALVALGNVGAADDPAVTACLSRYASGPDPLLAEHARWALDALGVDP
jgi:epoxyqueuosine reductase